MNYLKVKVPTSLVVEFDHHFFNGFEEKLDNLLKFLKPLGYMGIEIALIEPEKVPVKKLNEILVSYQMKVSALETGEIYPRFGFSLGNPVQEIREKAKGALNKFMELSANIEGVPKVIVGLIRGRLVYMQHKDDERVNLIESLKSLDPVAGDLGVQLVMEPINRFEIDSFHTLAEVVAFINETQLESVFPMIHSYHLNLEEDPGTIFDEIAVVAKQIKHVHLAGCNRRALGSGCFNIKKLLSTLSENGYWGFYSLDPIMKPSFEEVAQESAKFLQKIT